MDLLNRSANDPGAQALVNALNNKTMTMAQVAALITDSPEATGDLVKGFYTQFLHRSADAAGLSAWMQVLQGGASDQAVILGIVGSPEYFGL